MSDLIREPDELWTSYLIRRLEGEGMKFGEFETDRSADDCVRYYVRAQITESCGISLYREIHPLPAHSLKARKANYTPREDLANLLEEIEVEHPKEKGAVNIIFDPSENCELSDSSVRSMVQQCLPSYRIGKNYSSQATINNIIEYILKLKPVSGFPKLSSAEAQPLPSPREKTAASEPATTHQHDPRLDEILSTVRRLERVAAEHPIIMQGEDAYLRKLYVDTINRDTNSLKAFEYKGQNFPYILVDSDEIEGNVGKPCNNLYFVARDIATEPWQQQIVAVHESRCAKKGHEAAKKEEIKAARSLGKEKEYRQWRNSIDAKFK